MENLTELSEIVRFENLEDMSYTFQPACRLIKQSRKAKSYSSGWFYSRNSRNSHDSDDSSDSFNSNIFSKTYNSISKGIGKLFSKQKETKDYKLAGETSKLEIKDNKTMIDYKLADGSFELNDELIKLCNFELDKFYELSTKLNIIPKTLINYIVLIKLEKLKENKYKLIIQNLIVFLIEQDKDNYAKNYEEVKKNN